MSGASWGHINLARDIPEGTEIVLSQVYRFYDNVTGRTFHWDGGLANERIVQALWVRGDPPHFIINPQHFAAYIKHDRSLGPDPDPRSFPPVPYLQQMEIEIDKHAALALDPAACCRPPIAVPLPDQPAEHEGRIWIIDGWKRIWRAATLGWTELGCYLCTAEQELVLRIPDGWMRG